MEPQKEPSGFSRELRLLDSQDFSRVFKNPVRVANKAFTLLACSNGLGRPRLGLAIAKKQVKRAVDRNTIKRKLRNSFRLKQNELPAFDFVVMVRRDINSMDRKQMDPALSHLWQQVCKRCR